MANSKSRKRLVGQVMRAPDVVQPQIVLWRGGPYNPLDAGAGGHPARRPQRNPLSEPPRAIKTHQIPPQSGATWCPRGKTVANCLHSHTGKVATLWTNHQKCLGGCRTHMRWGQIVLGAGRIPVMDIISAPLGSNSEGGGEVGGHALCLVTKGSKGRSWESANPKNTVTK